MESEPLDLDAYLDRIDYHGPRSATAEVLHALHLAHTTHIPFENLDVLLGRPIRLDRPALVAKLVHGKRGGYCFEHNLLFAAVLQRLDFAVTLLAARVRYRTHRVLPRTHMCLAVLTGGRRWLADVGFGIAGLLFPLPMEPETTSTQFGWTFRLMEGAGTWLFQSWRDQTWQDLYAFTLEPQAQADYEMANYYVSTHPDSRFTQTLTAQLSTQTVRYALRNHEFVLDNGTQETARALAEEELLPLLAGTFGLVFPAGTRFRIPALQVSAG